MYGVFNVGEIYGVYGVLVIHQGVVIDVILDIKGGVLIMFGVFNLD